MTIAQKGVTVIDLFEDQVGRFPDAPAVVAGDRIVSYRQLDQAANRLAHDLQALGVGRDVPVAVLVHRSVEMTIGLLGILKAGGACLPIDPSVPEERVTFLLDDARPAVVLSEERLLGRLGSAKAAIVRLDRDWVDGADEKSAPDRVSDPEQVGYVIYTSGSTGVPKGVLLTQRGLVNHHLEVARLYQLEPGDRVLQFCSMSFDVSVEEMFPTWLSGATVVLRDDTVPILGRAWLDWLGRERVTMLNLPTAYWHEWVRDLQRLGAPLPDSVRIVTVGGEKALGHAYRSWRRLAGPGVRWVNAYGPTETTILATWFEPGPPGEPVSWQDPPIGRPLAHTTAYVLDASGHRVADGEVGELHLGGAGVARGYMNRPDLTAERFVADPFSPLPGARMYRTGDQARLLPEGDLEFVGRRDQQVKVRGFRIECGEVEAALLSHPEVADAAVVAREDTPGDRRLVGYVVIEGAGEVDGRALRRYLSERLPPYMIPTAFVVLAAFPTTAGGKVDRRALPPPDRTARGTSRAPATPEEQAVAAIWSQVLGIGDVSADDDFFDLGGHSLLATQVIAQLREAFAIDLPVHAIFESPTVEALAASLRDRVSQSLAPPLVADTNPAGAAVPLSLPQEQMWGLEIDASPPGLYNITALHRFSEPVDQAAVHRAMDHLVKRHDSLRTSFSEQGGEILQAVAPEVTIELPVADVAGSTAGEQEQQLLHLVAQQDAQPFDLGRTPLLRAGLYRLSADDSVLAVTFDHLISDGTSAYIFLSELAEVYGALARGEQPALPPLRLQYTDFAVWQRRWVTNERRQAQMEYWRRTLAGMPMGPALPFDRIPERPSRRIASRLLAVPGPLYRDLNHLARTARASVFVVAAAAISVVLHAAGGRSDIVLSTTLSGRQRAELDGVIGYFANIGRIRTDLAGNPAFIEVVARTRESVLGLFENQDIPFMQVRQALFPAFPSGAGGHPLAVLPVELQYFHAGQDGWAPGLGVVERPGPDKGSDELFFRGQLHPLSISLLDDGSQIWGEINYKTDFYDGSTIEDLALRFEQVLAAVAKDPERRLVGLATPSPGTAGPTGDEDWVGKHREVGTWRLDS